MSSLRGSLTGQEPDGHQNDLFIARVLVIEDDIKALETLCDFLQVRGFSPVQAKDAHEGMVHVMSDKFDFALIDINLPDRNGLELLELFSKNYEHMINIVITGHSSLESAKRAVALGADGYLVKPYQFETLVKLMLKCLKKNHVNIDFYQNEISLTYTS